MSHATGTISGWIDYDYAIVRVVPRVELSAFINVGVVLHARTTGYLDARFGYSPPQLDLCCHGIDLGLLDRFLKAYGAVCHGGVTGGPIGLLPPSERFHWLTAPRSAVLQTSVVHPGRCHDPGNALEELFSRHCQRSGM
jgi:hypothetical protein